jgi:hypothetical protein
MSNISTTIFKYLFLIFIILCILDLQDSVYLWEVERKQKEQTP